LGNAAPYLTIRTPQNIKLAKHQQYSGVVLHKTSAENGEGLSREAARPHIEDDSNNRALSSFNVLRK